MFEVERIETPENVELDLPLAGIGTRTIAGSVDALVIAAVFGLIFLVAVLGFELPYEDKGLVWTFVTVALFLLQWGYFFVLEWLLKGQTIGKRLVNIRVIKDTGAAASPIDLAIRNLLRPVDAFGAFFVGLVAMFVSPRCQRLGDLAASTLVISLAAPAVLPSLSPMRTTPLVVSPPLSPDEIFGLRTYLSRRYQLDETTTARILPALLTPILKRRSMSVPSNTQDMDDLVEQLLASSDQ
jgi:uncharacterized RDD family membrane protein YckC